MEKVAPYKKFSRKIRKLVKKLIHFFYLVKKSKINLFIEKHLN